MYSSGFEDAIVDKFISNDISGPVLLDLKIDDLKELDIQSFGKRHRVMSSIQHLRNSVTATPEPTQEAARSSPPPRRKSPSNECQSPITPNDKILSPATRRRRGRPQRGQEPDIISPAESVSIVAIEQLLPKPHKCSKGENCSKHQKYQRKLARLAKEFPNEYVQAGGAIITGNPGNPNTAENLLRPRSDAAPSVVASSDVLGPGQVPEFQLSAENLNEVMPRDPQESVRQFLNFQHVNTEPLEMFPPLAPPQSSQQPMNMATNLKNLPKLTIPGDSEEDGTFSPQRTITPSMGSRAMGSATATQEFNPYTYGGAVSPADMYRQTTPFSEVDVPITAIPFGLAAREASQSVPPDMRFGNSLQLPRRDYVPRSSSTRPEQQRRNPSFPVMDRLVEGRVLQPIEGPSDLASTPRAPQHSSQSSQSSQTSTSTDPDVTRSGWMKKRKTTRLLRHEWQDAHFTLKGTHLAMHKDERDALRDSKALERIDVDDFAVACSSLASSSKLSVAFKRSLLKKAATDGPGGASFIGNGVDDAAFAFSLIPSNANRERKALFASNGKSHHFSVKTRDERIDWMRELMLAKALKKGKEGGGEVTVNGNVI
jgi:hypothetical protein